MIEAMADDSPASSSVGRAFRRALKPVWYRLFRQHPYYYLGAALWRLMPGDEQQRMLAVFEQTAHTPLRFRTRCLLYYLDSCYYTRFADSATLPEPNRLRWGGPQAVASHLEALRNYEKNIGGFERDYASLLKRVEALGRENRYDYVAEIGCGNGLLIERLAAQAGDSGTVFVGLDLNAEILALNRERYAGSRVQYHQINSLQEFLGRQRPDRKSVV